MNSGMVSVVQPTASVKTDISDDNRLSMFTAITPTRGKTMFQYFVNAFHFVIKVNKQSPSVRRMAMQDVCAVRPAPTAKAKPITALIGLGFVLALVPRSHGRDAESSAKRNGGTMRHSIKRRVLVGVAGLAGVISTLWLAAPAQAAHRQITQEQVYYDIPDKYTPVPKRTLDGIDFELRAGHFEGSLYGWARINPGSNWNLDYILALNVTENGGTNWWYYEQTWKGENGWNHTRGRIAHAGANTKFRACLIKIDIYAKPDYWICTDPW